jgi:hypothetical protein
MRGIHALPRPRSPIEDNVCPSSTPSPPEELFLCSAQAALHWLEKAFTAPCRSSREVPGGRDPPLLLLVMVVEPMLPVVVVADLLLEQNTAYMLEN